MRLIQILINSICAIADNWFYLGRIGVYKWSSPGEEHFLSMIATALALFSLVIDLTNEVVTII